MRRTLFFLILSLLATQSGFTQPQQRYYKGRSGYTFTHRTQISLREEMDSIEFRAAGLDKLTGQQLRSLEHWLLKFVRSELEGERHNYLRIDGIDTREGLVTLEDGSVWKVASFDRGVMRGWQENQGVEVQTTNDIRGNIRLFNKVTRTYARAESIFQRSPDAKEEDILYTIKDTSRLGGRITLSDGSVWNVSTFDKRQARSWREGQEIEVRGERRTGRDVILYNRDLQETATGRMVYDARDRQRRRNANTESKETEQLDQPSGEVEVVP